MTFQKKNFVYTFKRRYLLHLFFNFPSTGFYVKICQYVHQKVLLAHSDKLSDHRIRHSVKKIVEKSYNIFEIWHLLPNVSETLHTLYCTCTRQITHLTLFSSNSNEKEKTYVVPTIYIYILCDEN